LSALGLETIAAIHLELILFEFQYVVLQMLWEDEEICYRQERLFSPKMKNKDFDHELFQLSKS
jgi:hypothetical protein